MRTVFVWILAAAAGCGSAAEPPPPAVGPLPDDSVYALDVPLVDQHGREIDLAVHRGRPVVISMFYASCPMACPRLIADLQALEQRLDADTRGELRVLLVSLDPDRDTPEAMAEVVARHGLDDTRWTLARTAPDDVRAVAAALGVRYRPTGGGEMNHSSLLTLLDRDGRVLARLEGLERDPAPLLTALGATTPGGAR